MKKCQNCNQTFDDAKKFCNKCGKPLEASKASDMEINSKKEVFEDKLKADPQNTGLLIGHAKFLIEYELLNDALPILYRVQAIDPNNLLAKRMLLECYSKLNNAEKVLQIGKEIILKQPQDKAALMLVANIEFENDSYADCLAHVDQIIWLDPASFAALRMKAQILFKTGKEAESFSVWQKAYSLDTTDMFVNIFMGIAACEAKEYENAVELLQPVIEKNVTTSDEMQLASIYFLHAQSKLNAPGNEIENGINKFLMSAALGKITRVKTRQVLACVYMYVGDTLASQAKYREAREFFEKAKEAGETQKSDKAIGGALLNIGKEEFGKKNYDEARKYFADAIKNCPDDKECNTFLARIANKERKRELCWFQLCVALCC